VPGGARGRGAGTRAGRRGGSAGLFSAGVPAGAGGGGRGAPTGGGTVRVSSPGPRIQGWLEGLAVLWARIEGLGGAHGGPGVRAGARMLAGGVGGGGRLGGWPFGRESERVPCPATSGGGGARASVRRAGGRRPNAVKRRGNRRHARPPTCIYLLPIIYYPKGIILNSREHIYSPASRIGYLTAALLECFKQKKKRLVAGPRAHSRPTPDFAASGVLRGAVSGAIPR